MPAERLSTYTRCTSCRGLMLWCVSAINGKRVPLEPRPHPDGIVVVTNLPDGTVRGRYLTGAELPAQVEAHRLHDRVCPGKTEPETGPKCGACRTRLDERLVELGYTRHPGCMSTPAPRPAPAVESTPPAPVHSQGELFDLTGGAA